MLINTTKILTCCFILFSSHLSYAEYKQSASVGLGYAKIDTQNTRGQGIHLPKSSQSGVHVKYRLETENRVGLIGTSSYLSGDKTIHGQNNQVYKSDANYFSLLVGPAIRVNELFSLYGTLGYGWNKIDGHPNASEALEQNAFKKGSLAYGAGVIFDINPSVSINLGYEASSFGSGRSRNSGWSRVYSNDIDMFNISVGYHF